MDFINYPKTNWHLYHICYPENRDCLSVCSRLFLWQKSTWKTFYCIVFSQFVSLFRNNWSCVLLLQMRVSSATISFSTYCLCNLWTLVGQFYLFATLPNYFVVNVKWWVFSLIFLGDSGYIIIFLVNRNRFNISFPILKVLIDFFLISFRKITSSSGNSVYIYLLSYIIIISRKSLVI